MKRTELLDKLQDVTKDNVWQAELLIWADSEPRYRALNILNEGKKRKDQIVWNFEATDFKGQPEPIVIEFMWDGDGDKVGQTEINKMLQDMNVKFISRENITIVI